VGLHFVQRKDLVEGDDDGHCHSIDLEDVVAEEEKARVDHKALHNAEADGHRRCNKVVGKNAAGDLDALHAPLHVAHLTAVDELVLFFRRAHDHVDKQGAVEQLNDE